MVTNSLPVRPKDFIIIAGLFFELGKIKHVSAEYTHDSCKLSITSDRGNECVITTPALGMKFVKTVEEYHRFHAVIRPGVAYW